MKFYESIAVVLAVVTGAAKLHAQTPNDRMAQLESRIQSLEAQLKQSRQSDAATVEKVMADAKARSGAVSGGKVGYSNGYFLADEKNNFQVKLNGFLQTRYLYNHNESSTEDNDEFGFQIRRAELYVSGNMFNPSLFYQFSGGFDRASGTFSIVSAYGGYQFNKSAEIRAGIFKPPFMIEELTSSGRQEAVERSLVNALFTMGTSEGVQGQYSKNNYRVAVMVHDGTSGLSSEFNADKTDFGLAVRGELKLAGEWSQFADFQGWKDTKPAARLGLALDYEAGETGDATTNPNTFKYTADAAVKGSGWNAFLAGAGRHTQDDGSAAGGREQYGLLAQGGVFVIANRAEVFARYEHIFLDGFFGTATAIDNHVNLATVGVNWFFLGHNAKITTDVIYVCDAIPSASTGLGLLASDGGAQVIVRAGLFLMF